MCPSQSVHTAWVEGCQLKQELGSFCSLRSFPSLDEKIHASWYSKSMAMNGTKKISCEDLRSTSDDRWRGKDGGMTICCCHRL